MKMQIFFLNGLWRLLRNGHLPVKLHSSAPPSFGKGTVLFLRRIRATAHAFKSHDLNPPFRVKPWLHVQSFFTRDGDAISGNHCISVARTNFRV